MILSEEEATKLVIMNYKPFSHLELGDLDLEGQVGFSRKVFVVAYKDHKVVVKLKPQTTTFLQIYKHYEEEVNKVIKSNRFGPDIIFENHLLVLEKHIEGETISNELF